MVEIIINNYVIPNLTSINKSVDIIHSSTCMLQKNTYKYLKSEPVLNKTTKTSLTLLTPLNRTHLQK